MQGFDSSNSRIIQGPNQKPINNYNTNVVKIVFEGEFWRKMGSSCLCTSKGKLFQSLKNEDEYLLF